VREFPFYLAGKPGRSDRPLEITNPFDGSVVAGPGSRVPPSPTPRLTQLLVINRQLS
jgi:hypothetical protein